MAQRHNADRTGSVSSTRTKVEDAMVGGGARRITDEKATSYARFAGAPWQGRSAAKLHMGSLPSLLGCRRTVSPASVPEGLVMKGPMTTFV